jgi:hypothetical protein
MWPNKGYKSEAVLLHLPVPFETDECRDLRAASYNASLPTDTVENKFVRTDISEKVHKRTNRGTHIHVSL